MGGIISSDDLLCIAHIYDTHMVHHVYRHTMIFAFFMQNKPSSKFFFFLRVSNDERHEF